MINRGFRFILSIFSSLIILLICLNYNVKDIKGKTINKEVKDEMLEIEVSDKQDSIIKKYAKNYIKNNKSKSLEVINITNKYRNELNLNYLEYDEDLSISATLRAFEIAFNNYFSHTRPNGTNFSTTVEIDNTKMTFIGENIARGYDTEIEVCEAWKESQGHYENMVNKNYKKIGIGYFEYNGVIYWSQIFTN